MTKDELWMYAVNYCVRPGSLKEQGIQKVLALAGGNVTEALKLMSKVHYHPAWKGEHMYPGDSLACQLGNGGCSGPDSPAVFRHGTAAKYPIHAYLPGTRYTHNPPDLVIEWREVFEFIKAGRRRPVQLDLFSALTEESK